MGIRSRYAAAFLILCLAPGIVQGAVRQTLKPSAERIITESIQGVTLPNGAAAYYGHDRLYALDISVNARAGDVVGPTIRPVRPSTVGVPSFPYGGQPFYPDMSSPQLKVKPKAVVPKAPVISKFKNALKLTPANVVLSAGTIAALAAVDYLLDQSTGKLTVVEDVSLPLTDGNYTWAAPMLSGVFGSSPVAACQATVSAFPQAYASVSSVSSRSGGHYLCHFVRPNGTSDTLQTSRYGSGCAVGTFKSGADFAGCYAEQQTPVTPQQIDALDLSGIPQHWFDDILRDTCKGSPSPNSCFEELRSESPVEGPSVVQGLSSVSTQTRLNPDGSTTTTTTTTQREHPISYGNGYFDVGTRETRTTEVDGVPVSTEVTEDTRTPAPSDPNAEPDPDPSEQEYSFTDPDFPDIEPFYEVQYPDGLSGVWSDTFAALQDTAFVEFMQGFVPTFSGSCPAFGLSFQIAQWASFGSLDFVSICYVLDFVKILLLVTAMFTSRAIIFGG